MSDAFWNNLPATLTAIGTLVAVILLHFRTAHKIAENTQITKDAKQVTEETKEKLSNGLAESIEEIHKATNGMQGELVKATALAEFAKGVLAGRSQLAAEQKDKV